MQMWRTRARVYARVCVCVTNSSRRPRKPRESVERRWAVADGRTADSICDEPRRAEGRRRVREEYPPLCVPLFIMLPTSRIILSSDVNFSEPRTCEHASTAKPAADPYLGTRHAYLRGKEAFGKLLSVPGP